MGLESVRDGGEEGIEGGTDDEGDGGHGGGVERIVEILEDLRWEGGRRGRGRNRSERAGKIIGPTIPRRS